MNVNRKFYAVSAAAVFLLGAALYASSKPEQTGITVTGTGIVPPPRKMPNLWLR